MSSRTLGDTELVPPIEMLFDGSSSREQFIALGEGFSQELLIKRARLTPDSAFLDLGCGNGSVARALAQWLSPAGRYEGLDVNAASVEWLSAHYRAFPNFHFQWADVYNKMYNPAGRYQPTDYRFPFPDSSFDVLLLKSVFTHMLPEDVRAYTRECARVLRPGGRAVMTYFLLNEESTRYARGTPKLRIEVEWQGDPLCRVESAGMPENAVAHDEARIRQYIADAGLSISEMAFGDWCGRPTMLGLQDLIIAVKG